MRRYSEIASLLNVNTKVLSSKCGISRGNFICWIAREILSMEYYHLESEYIEYLLNILRRFITSGIRDSEVWNEMFNDGTVVLKDDYLMRLVRRYSIDNPFKVVVK